jgi:putative transposase
VTYPMSYRQLEEMMRERGVSVDHSTLNRWVIKYAAEIENSSATTGAPWARAGAWMRRR